MHPYLRVRAAAKRRGDVNAKTFLSSVLLMALASAAAQLSAAEPPAAPPEVSGHWEGQLEAPGMPIEIRVDLARSADGTWTGTLDVPAQGIRGLPLDAITVEGRAVNFKAPGIPGEPTFKGLVSEDGAAISGDMTQAGHTIPFSIRRKEKAEGEDSASIYRDFLQPGKPGVGLAGSWRGLLEAGPMRLRLMLNVKPGADGALSATLDSLDQKALGTPVDTLTLDGRAVHFEIGQIHGTYQGTLTEDGAQIEGQWTQGGAPLPLTFKRAESSSGK